MVTFLFASRVAALWFALFLVFTFISSPCRRRLYGVFATLLLMLFLPRDALYCIVKRVDRDNYGGLVLLVLKAAVVIRLARYHLQYDSIIYRGIW